ncbi:MAG: hypothetical protein AAFR40_18560, partial [Pseudomonadota bacterium]
MSRHGFWIAVGIATGAHLVAGSLYLPEALASRKAPEVAISITDGTAYAQMVEKWNQTPDVTGDAAALSSPQDFTLDRCHSFQRMIASVKIDSAMMA